MTQRTCCFIGHRKIKDTYALRTALSEILEHLISVEHIDTFLFGSKSEFNSLCYELVSKAKEKHPHIKRIYVRAEFPYIDDSYRSYLLEQYEDTFFPHNMITAKKAVYVERNCKMIDDSRICVFYYSPNYSVPNPTASKQRSTAYQPNSGTQIAFDYAQRKGKKILQLP